MGPGDNGIPLPGGPPRDLARAMVGELLSQGHSPQAVISALMGAASDRMPSMLPARRQPTPAAPPGTARTYRVRVDLDGAKTPIWRRLELRSDLRLDQLHPVLQTAMGAGVAGDPEAMWQVLCRSLPAGKKQHEKHAGVVALLCVAAGHAPNDGVRRLGPEVMSWAGWSTEEGRMDQWLAYDCARSTLDVLALTGCRAGWRQEAPPTEPARRLARAASRG